MDQKPEFPNDSSKDKLEASFGRDPEITVTSEAPDAPDAPPVPPQFPEGGLRAWLVVLGAFCILFSTFGYLNAYGIYQEYYASHQLRNESSSTIAWIGSIQVFFQFMGGLIGGPLFDRYGAVVIAPPALTFTLSIMLTSLCKEYYQFLLCQGVFGGISNGMLFTPAMSSIGHYFRTKKMGAAIGIAVCGSSIGGVIFPIALTKMFPNPRLGFGWSVRIIGFIIFFMLSLAILTIRARLPPRKEGWRRILLLDAFKAKAYSLYLVAMFFSLWGLFTPFFYVTEYAMDHGMDTNLASYLVSMLNAASFFGRLLPGLLADKFGRFNTIIIAAVVTTILLFCWIAAKSTGGIIAFSVLYGFFSGAIISLMAPCVALLTPDPRNIGTYLGMGMAVFSIAGLTGTPICGALLSHYGSYVGPVCFSGAVMCVGAVLLAVVRVMLRKDLLVII